MATITNQQAEQYLWDAGFRGSELPKFIAIAHCESSMNTTAKNSIPCLGIWQINVRAHPPQSLGISKATDLYDPAVNAKAAHQIFKREGYKAWTTYGTSRYDAELKKVLQDKTLTAGRTSTETAEPAAENTVDNVATSISTIGPAIQQFGETVRRSSVVALVILVAIALVVLGIVMINKDSLVKLGGKAAKVAAVIPK